MQVNIRKLRNTNQNLSYQNDLRLIRKEVRNLGRRVRMDPKNFYLLQFFSCEKTKFNQLRKKLKHEYYVSMAYKIDNLKCQNSNDFWTILKENKTKSSNTTSPPIRDIVNHYKSLLCSKNDNSMSPTPDTMLITLPRGYEKCPFDSLFSFIHIMFFHVHGIRSRVEQGAPWLQ